MNFQVGSNLSKCFAFHSTYSNPFFVCLSRLLSIVNDNAILRAPNGLFFEHHYFITIIVVVGFYTIFILIEIHHENYFPSIQQGEQWNSWILTSDVPWLISFINLVILYNQSVRIYGSLALKKSTMSQMLIKI